MCHARLPEAHGTNALRPLDKAQLGANGPDTRRLMANASRKGLHKTWLQGTASTVLAVYGGALSGPSLFPGP